MPSPSRILIFISGTLLSSLAHYLFQNHRSPPSPYYKMSQQQHLSSQNKLSQPRYSTWNSSTIPLRVITHNIRYATSWGARGNNERPWSDRLPLLISELEFLSRGYEMVFICLQEVLKDQLLDIMEGLNGRRSEYHTPQITAGEDDEYGRVESDREECEGEEWSFIGVGRDDGKMKGEYSPVIYRRNLVKCTQWRTSWLSETPWKPSRGWDAACTRLLTHGTFQVQSHPNTSIAVMSTHLDHYSPRARQNSARIILNHAKFYSPLPFIIAGDFNSAPDDVAYKTVVSQPELLGDLGNLITQQHQPRKNVYGETNTWTGFTPKTKKEVIDFLFLGPWGDGGDEGGAASSPWRLKGYSVIPNVFEDGVYVSDHRAVVGDLEVEVKA